MEEDCQDEVTNEVVALWSTLGLGGRHICLMTAQQLELLVWHWTCLQSDHQKAGCRPFSEVLPGKKPEDLGERSIFGRLSNVYAIRFPRSLPVVEMFSSEGLLRRCGSTNRLATKMSNFYIKHPQKHLTNPTRNHLVDIRQNFHQKARFEQNLAGSVQSKTWMRFGAAFGRRGRWIQQCVIESES